MKPQKSVEPTEPPISVLPSPSKEEILARDLEQVRMALKEAEAERDRLNAICLKLETINAEAKQRIAMFEENPLTFALNNLDAGQVLIEAGDKLRELAAVVRKREAKGVFSLKIGVKPFKGDALVFVPAISITEPKPEPAQSVFYSGEDGSLSRNDPRQREFSM